MDSAAPAASGGLASLRRPHLSSSGAGGGGVPATGGATGGVAAFTRRCRRNLLLDGDGAAADDDDDGPLYGDGSGNSAREASARAALGEDTNVISSGGSGGKRDSGSSEPTMEQCVSLLAPHLAAFRDRCSSSSDGGSSSAAANESAKDDGDGDDDEVPPQLLRVARFFRWRWGPLKKALLRPACSDDDDDTNGKDGGEHIEVGSAYRLRLARALRSRGLLAVAEVDGLSASFDRRRLRRCRRRRSSSVGIDQDSSQDDIGDGSPSKRRRLGEDEDEEDDEEEDGLVTRVRMALSRLPSDAAAGPGAAGRRGVRHARAVLDECRSHWRDGTSTDTECGRDAMGGRTRSNATARPTPDEVADWALTAFAGVVLTNGVDYSPGRRKRTSSGAGTTPGKPKDGDDAEFSVAVMLLDQLGRSLSEKGGGTSTEATFGELGLAIGRRIAELTAPPLIDGLSGLHLLTLARWFYHLPTTIVEDYVARTSVACARAGGGAGLTSLPKLVASYLSLVGESNRGNSACMAASALEVGVRRRLREGVGLRRELDEAALARTIHFLDVVLRAVRFLLLSPKS